ncbi:MAG TPA: M20 family metallopeptidase [Thermoplasmata archaeon]|nr:M20 family metallopeptidase [Thermoplasmata archaeon]
MNRWRQEFHRHPELAYREFRTRTSILAALRRLSIPARSFGPFPGVVGIIAGDAAGPVVALRADMDGLPVQESTGLPFSSREAGAMHACGHDVHMSCLLGAAALLQAHRDELRGPVKLLFQPAEEDGSRGGAQPMIEKGCLEHPKVDFVLGQHVAPEIPVGAIGWKSGPMMAAADHLVIRVFGRPGHAAYPHRGPDAIVAAAEVVTGLQALVSRSRNPLDPVVVSIGSVHGGTRRNILPECVVLEGTVRTFSPRVRSSMERLIRTRVDHLARSLGTRAEVDYVRGYPTTVNDPGVTARLVEGFTRELGPRHVVPVERPVMGAEDFSRYLERVPGCFWFLGAQGAGPAASLHSPTFAPPPETLETGTAALVTATLTLQEAG